MKAWALPTLRVKANPPDMRKIWNSFSGMAIIIFTRIRRAGNEQMEMDRAVCGRGSLCYGSYIHGREMGYTLCLFGAWL